MDERTTAKARHGSRKPKLSQLTADRLIVDLVRLRAEDRDELGTEDELIRRLGVARGTLREALRQLEWQGVVRIRRGVKGGIRASRPDDYVPMFMLKVFFELSDLSLRELRQAFRALQRARDYAGADGGNRVLDLLSQSADGQFTAALVDALGANPRARRLSETVAYAITLEIEDRDLAPGSSLGSEADLIRRLGVGRGVVREALRLMELNQVIELRRGIGGGAFVAVPSPNFAIYVTAVHFALADTPPSQIAAAQHGLLHAISGAAPDVRAGRDGEGMLQSAARGIALAREAGNLPLTVFMRILATYWQAFGGLGSTSLDSDDSRPRDLAKAMRKVSLQAVAA